MRIPQFLAEHDVAFETILHPPAYTAHHRAKYLGISGREVAKAVLLVGPQGYLLAVLPAVMHVDLHALHDLLGGPVRFATSTEIEGVFRDCEWGVVGPFGKLYGVPTILEDSLSPDAVLVFESNSHSEDVRLRCRDYERLESPRRLRFATQDPRFRHCQGKAP